MVSSRATYLTASHFCLHQWCNGTSLAFCLPASYSPASNQTLKAIRKAKTLSSKINVAVYRGEGDVTLVRTLQPLHCIVVLHMLISISPPRKCVTSKKRYK